jgi:hypothetical protein
MEPIRMSTPCRLMFVWFSWTYDQSLIQNYNNPLLDPEQITIFFLAKWDMINLDKWGAG